MTAEEEGSDRKRSEVRKRTKLVGVRLLPEEFETLRAMAAARKASVGEVLRSGALELGPELIPIWPECFEARWMVSTASDRDPTGDNYWSGWTDVDADARRGVVELGGTEYTPAEARNLATALEQAADHAEHFGTRYASLIEELRFPGGMPEISHLPDEQQCVIRDALHAVAERYRRQQHSPGARRAEVSP